LRAHQGKPVDLAVELTRTTLDVLERTIFSDGLGRDAEEIRRGMKVYFESVGRIDPFDMLGIPSAIPRFTRFGIRPTMRLFAAAIDTIIATRRRRIAENPNAAPHDILTLLLKAEDPDSGRRLSEQEVRANVLTFIAAGHETTANCMTWASYLLSQSPEWQERVQNEADREAVADVGILADRLVETRAVIDETNRLYPPIAAISRVALDADELAGERISRGTIVVIAPYVLHRHRSLWSRPDEFDPNRFLGDARERIGRFAYLPFGAGPRVCIGAGFAMQEASIVLATLLRNFSLTLSPSHRVWPVQKFTVRPKDGLPMILQSRA
jgi:cytochrome P450